MAGGVLAREHPFRFSFENIKIRNFMFILRKKWPAS